MGVHHLPPRSAQRSESFQGRLVELLGTLHLIGDAHRDIDRHHMAILALNPVLGVDRILPFVIGSFDREVVRRVEDLMAVAAKIGPAVMLRVGRFMERRDRVIERCPLGLARVDDERGIPMLEHRCLLQIGPRDGVADIARDPHLRDCRCGKGPMEALVRVEFNCAGRDADRAVASSAVIEILRIRLDGERPQRLVHRILERVGVHRSIPALVLCGVALPTESGVFPVLRTELAMTFDADVRGREGSVLCGSRGDVAAECRCGA